VASDARSRWIAGGRSAARRSSISSDATYAARLHGQGHPARTA
jgi:hypothetical protein